MRVERKNGMQKTKIAALFLSVLLIFLAFPINAFCTEEEFTENNVSTDLSATTLDASCVPEIISYDVAIAAGHISRDYSQEQTLNSVVFKNNDGTDTWYLFDEDVKYIDKDGTIKDKSNVLVKNKDGSYSNKSNDIELLYPAKLSSGVTLNYDGITMVMAPESTLSSQSLSVSSDSEVKLIENSTDAIEYFDVFGEKTKVKYTQTYSGFKEDIILQENPHKNTFAFMVVTKGAELRNENGTITMYSKDEKIGSFGAIVIYDSFYNYALGTAELETIAEGMGYRIIITAPEEFLDSPSTVYPVTVDPSFNIQPSDNESDADKIIRDATIFTNHKANFGTWMSLFVGNFNLYYPDSPQQRGTARTIMSFPGLSKSTTFKTLYNTGRVTSVCVNFADIHMDNGPNTIRAYRMKEIEWDESTIYYDPDQEETAYGEIWDGYELTYSGGIMTIVPTEHTIPYPRYQIDIINIIDYNKKNHPETDDWSIMLKSTNEAEAAVVLGSSESGNQAGRLDSKPYITINYISMPTTEDIDLVDGGIYHFANSASGNGMSYSEALTQQTYDPSDINQQFKVKYKGNGTYAIIPMSNTAYCIGANASNLFVNTQTFLQQQQWRFVRIAYGVYRIYNSHNNNYLLTTLDSSTDVYSQNSSQGSLWVLKLVRYDVPLYEQEESNTCGPACAVMALHYYGCPDVTEDDIVDNKEVSEFSTADYIKTKLNVYLSNNDSTLEYRYKYAYSFASESEYVTTIRNNIANNSLVFVQAKIPENNVYFPYDTDGHWLLIVGVYYHKDLQTYVATINDPHHTYSSMYHVPLSVIYQYNLAHGGCVLIEDT